MKTLIAAIVVCLVSLSLSCGSDNSNSPTSTNPLHAISNGATLATATSYWGCEDCVPGFLLHMTFTDDGAFQTIVTGNGPGSTTCTGKVSQQNLNSFALGGSCSDANGSVKEITGITGSTSSGAFTAAATDVSMNGGAGYAGCAFTLVQGQQGQ